VGVEKQPSFFGPAIQSPPAAVALKLLKHSYRRLGCGTLAAEHNQSHNHKAQAVASFRVPHNDSPFGSE
jgi:hypothetical protein